MPPSGVWTANQFLYKPPTGANTADEENAFESGLDLVDAHLGKYKTLGDPGYETLAAALTSIGTEPRTLFIPAGTVNITSSLTIPENVHLVFLNGARFNIASGVTLTMYCRLTAEPCHIFSWSGTGTLGGQPWINEVYPEWFGAVCDGTTDDYAAVAKCLEVAQSWGIPVRFTPAIYKINTKLPPIDISRTRLLGTPGTKLDFTGLTTSGIDQFAIQLYSTATYSSTIDNRVAAMADLTIVGAWDVAGKKNHVGLCIGHGTYTRNAEFMVDRVVIQGFKYAIRLLQNVWLLTFNDCMLRWGAMYVGTGLSNMGSKLLFNNFFFESGAGDITELGTGDYYFHACYFDNHWVKIVGEVKAHFHQCVWENTGSTTTSGYWLELTSGASAAYVLMDDNQIYFMNPGADYTTALFKVDGAVVQRGLHIRNLWIDNPWSWYKPETTESWHSLFAGTGRITVDGVNAWHSGGRVPPIAYYPNAIYNGGLELGNLNGWSTGGTGTVSAATDDKKLGTYSMKMVCSAGQSCYAIQEFNVKPGQLVLASMWNKLALTSGNATITLVYYSVSGQTVSSDELHGDQTDWQQFTSGTGGSWVVRQIRSFVPRGAAKCRLELSAASTSGTTTCYWDAVIVNVV